MSYPSKRIIEATVRAAQDSKHPQFRMAAMVYRSGGFMESWGVNKRKTHPRSNNKWRTIHAELDAILGVNQQHLKGTSILVLRLTKTNLLATSRPCDYCMILLQEVGIHEVYYVDNHRQIVKEEV